MLLWLGFEAQSMVRCIREVVMVVTIVIFSSVVLDNQVTIVICVHGVYFKFSFSIIVINIYWMFVYYD